MSRAEFIDALNRFGVSPFQETSDELVASSASLPWDEFDRAHGVIALGGDALKDCAALHDDE